LEAGALGEGRAAGIIRKRRGLLESRTADGWKPPARTLGEWWKGSAREAAWAIGKIALAVVFFVSGLTFLRPSRKTTERKTEAADGQPPEKSADPPRQVRRVFFGSVMMAMGVLVAVYALLVD
jgi:hypothetical protein